MVPLDSPYIVHINVGTYNPTLLLYEIWLQQLSDFDLSRLLKVKYDGAIGLPHVEFPVNVATYNQTPLLYEIWLLNMLNVSKLTF